MDASDLKTVKAQVTSTALYYTREMYREMANKNLFLAAQAIAFKVLVTIVPVVILGTGLIGRLLRSQRPFDTVAGFIRDFLPPTQSEQLVTFLSELHGASGAITLIGAASLFLSVVSLFITLRIAVTHAFEQDWHVGRSLLGGYLFDARMVLQVGLLFVLTVGLSVLGRSMESTVLVEWLGLDYVWIQEGWRQALRIFGYLAPFMLTLVMFHQLYYFVPRPHPRQSSAFLGAFVAGVLWEGAKQGFALYATYVGFGQYQSGGEGLAALGNVFGLIVAFVFWVYFSGIVLMVGAVIASLHDHRRRDTSSGSTSGPNPKTPDAAGGSSTGASPPRAPAVPAPSPETEAASSASDEAATPTDQPVGSS